MQDSASRSAGYTYPYIPVNTGGV